MIDQLIAFSLKQRFITLALVLSLRLARTRAAATAG